MDTQPGRDAAFGAAASADQPATATPEAPRSRRSLLVAAVGGLAASVAAALGRPAPAAGAAGDTLKIGQQNFAGTSATRLGATSSGGAFWMTQNGTGSGIRGDSTNGHGGVFNTSHADRYGINAANLGAGGAGAAIRADGGENDGIAASASAFLKDAVHGTHSGLGFAIHGTASAFEGVAVRGDAPNGIGVQGSSDTSYAGSFIGEVYFSEFLEISQSTTPTPVTGRVKLFARASGGHSQLVALFQDGTQVVLGASIDSGG